MKQALLLTAFSLTSALAVNAQTDTTRPATVSDTTVSKSAENDTIRIGGMVIISRPDEKGDRGEHRGHRDRHVTVNWDSKPRRISRLHTSWFNMDLGFTNFNDQTDYTSAAAREYARAVRPGEAPFTESDLRLIPGKSSNFNLWIIRQRYGITRDNKFHAKWGLMLETNNYRYDNEITYVKGSRPFLFRDSVSFRKNKLAADYITVPLLFGFSSKPRTNGGFTFSGGVSIGYLYSSRNKQVSEGRGKEKIRGSFDLEPWKFQYQAEIGLGLVKLYGSYAPQSIYRRGLDMRPYSVGLRLGDW